MAALQRVGDYGVAVIKEFGDKGLQVRIDSPGPLGFFMGPQLSRQRVLYFLMTHSQDTYGQLVVYARMNGDLHGFRGQTARITGPPRAAPIPCSSVRC